MPKTPDAPISIRFDPDVRTALEKLAKADSRTLSAYIKLVMRQHVDASAKKVSVRDVR